MNTFVLEVFDDTRKLCTFYTVRLDEAEESETDRFFSKYYANEALKTSVQELVAFIFKKIGDKEGAREFFFRFENSAQALPPSGKHEVSEITIDYNNFPLRLYCLRISDALVILFNGGEKTSQTAQTGDTRTSFLAADQFAKRILKALREKEIEITNNGRNFKSSYGDDEILLYNT
jgi:hypothetical protein